MASDCPSAEELRRWLEDGQVSPALEEHVETCRACQRAAEQLLARTRLGPGPASESPAATLSAPAAALLRRLEGVPPAEPGPADDVPPTVMDPRAVTAAPAPPRLAGYEVLGQLGKGGMGVVWRARDRRLKREVAIKVMKEELSGQLPLVRRFIEEAQVASQLQHPAIPPVHEMGELPDGRPYFAMKVIRGRTLADLLEARSGPADDRPRFLHVFEQVGQALAYAHSKGVIHRDLKPSNVMVSAFGEVQVMDWGLAKVLAAEARVGAADAAGSVVETEGRSPTQVGVALGTYAYMPPEQARGDVEQLDRRCDVFGLGAILCEVLTGQPPYVGTAGEVKAQAQEGQVAPARERLEACGAHGELVELARQCLSARAEERPADAAAVTAALTAHLAGVQERLRQAERERAAAEVRVAEERKRRRVWLALAAAVLLLVLAGGGGAWWRQQQRQRADDAVAGALAEAGRLLAKAKAATTVDDLAIFAQALASARKADELARTGGASDEVRRQAADLLAALNDEAETDRRDRLLLAALLEVRGPREGPKFRKDHMGLMVALPEPSAEEQFRTAFQEWDPTFDVDALPTEAAAAGLKRRPPAVVTEVIAALDEWAQERRQDGARQRKDAAEWRRRWQCVADLAAALDESAPQRRELRGVLMRGGPEHGPEEDRDRLRRLAETVDVTREPVLGLLTLARALRGTGEDALAEALLKKGLRARPREVLLHDALGHLLEDQRPPRWVEAARHYTAVRVLRPELGESLACALVSGGQGDDGLALYEQLVAERPNNPWLRLRHGHFCLTQHRYPEAEAACREAVHLKPDYPEAHVNLGVALAHQGRHREAEAAYREAIRIQPDLPQAHNNLGYDLGEQGRYQEAEAACLTATRLEPGDALPRINLGRILLRQERFTEAEAASREAIRLDPDDPRAHTNLAGALSGLERYTEAEAACRKAIHLNPDLSEAHNNLGNALGGQRRHKEAEAAYREAIRLKPDNSQAHYNLGVVLRRQGRTKEAEAAIREALRLQPDDPQAHVNLGVILRRQGRPKEAETAYRKAIRLKPDFPTAHYNLGNALSDQGRVREAEAAYREAIRLQPDYFEAHTNLGNLQFEQGRPREAEVEYREAVRIQPDNPEAHTNLGAVLCDGLSRYEEAEAEFRAAVRLRPDYPEAHTNLGVTLNAQGRYREAEAACREALRLHPDFPEAHNAHKNLGTALRRQGRSKEAEAAYREVMRLKPDDPTAHCNLGHSLRDQGRFAEALEALRRGQALGSKTPDWRSRSGAWVRQCERLVELDRRLPAILAGQAEPTSPVERIEFASLCQQYRRRPVTATRLYGAAFMAEPKLADDWQAGHRYDAACSAALAAAGQGEDAKGLPDKVRLMLRRQALGWLRADLALYAQLAEREVPGAKQTVRQKMRLWRQDADLASVRDSEALGKLPDDERQPWRQLWMDVGALLKKVDQTK